MAGESSPDPLPNNVDKAERILGGEDVWDVIGGNKVTRFYLNLIGREEVATIDMWTLRGLLGDDTLTDGDYKALTDKSYAALECVLQAEARKVGLTTAQYQAVLWIVIRGAAE
jgi:thermostable 8-oxoguanine DNA glycosylase